MITMTLDSIAMAGPFGNYKPTHKAIIHPVKSTFQHLIELAEIFCKAYKPETTDPKIAIVKDQRYSLCDTLTSPQIQEFLHTTTHLEHYDGYPVVIGMLATRLIQNTHNSGTNEFEFDLDGIKPLDNFGYYLKRREDENLHVIVHGELGKEAFSYSCCDATVEAAHLAFSSPAIGTFNIWRWYRSCSLGSYDMVYSPKDKDDRWIRYVQYGPLLLNRYIYSNIWQEPMDQGISPSVRRFYYYDNSCTSLLLQDKLQKGLCISNLRLLNNKEFDKLWEPAVEPFARMQTLFGVRS